MKNIILLLLAIICLTSIAQARRVKRAKKTKAPRVEHGSIMFFVDAGSSKTAVEVGRVESHNGKY